jgi:putative transposase
MEGHPSGVVWGLIQRRPRALPELEEDGRLREADELDGRALCQTERWDLLEVPSDGFQENSPAPLGGEKTGKNPTDRGKQGAKINLLVDERGAPLSVVLTGANRHDKISALDLIVSIVLKRPAQKQQHLCADKAYDASDVREFASSEGGYTTHIKVNPRKKASTESSSQSSQQREPSHGEPHPARRWVVERTISWLVKRGSLRTRWSKKAENWLALIQLA